MLRQLALYTTLSIFPITHTTLAHSCNDADPSSQRPASSPGDFAGASQTKGRRCGSARHSVPTAPLPETLSRIASWLSSNFGLPGTQRLPQVEFARQATLTAMRYGSASAIRRYDNEIHNHIPTKVRREVVAVYDDSTETIFLTNGWSDARPVDVSVLVHEMVHHLQNLGKLRYECPAAREKLAYLAQDRWLRLFGKTLEKEFDADPMTVLVTTTCMS